MTDSAPDDDADKKASGRDAATESEPTESGHSTAKDEAARNREDESPS